MHFSSSHIYRYVQIMICTFFQASIRLTLSGVVFFFVHGSKYLLKKLKKNIKSTRSPLCPATIYQLNSLSALYHPNKQCFRPKLSPLFWANFSKTTENCKNLHLLNRKLLSVIFIFFQLSFSSVFKICLLLFLVGVPSFHKTIYLILCSFVQILSIAHALLHGEFDSQDIHYLLLL